MATCSVCGMPCGPDVPGATVAHLSCAASTAAMRASAQAAQLQMPQRASPDIVSEHSATMAYYRNGGPEVCL